MKDERLLVFIGPSGVGKSSVVRILQDRRLIQLIPSWTTRAPRLLEHGDNVDHLFVSEEKFESKAKSGFFLEEVALFGLPYRYGLPPIPTTLLLSNTIATVVLRAPLLPLLAKHYKDYVIYQIEDSYEHVSDRLKRREAQGEKQGERLKGYDKEMAAGHRLADRIFMNNKSILDLAARIESAIRADFKPKTAE